MSTEESKMAARIMEHDVRNQLGTIYLAVEGLKAELIDYAIEDFTSYTDIVINCCKHIENIIKQGNVKQ